MEHCLFTYLASLPDWGQFFFLLFFIVSLIHASVAVFLNFKFDFNVLYCGFFDQ